MRYIPKKTPKQKAPPPTAIEKLNKQTLTLFSRIKNQIKTEEIYWSKWYANH